MPGVTAKRLPHFDPPPDAEAAEPVIVLSNLFERIATPRSKRILISLAQFLRLQIAFRPSLVSPTIANLEHMLHYPT